MKKYNFNAGPSILPAEVIKQTAEAVVDFQGEGLSTHEGTAEYPRRLPSDFRGWWCKFAILHGAFQLPREESGLPQHGCLVEESHQRG